MRFGIFYEHQLPRPWTDGAEHRLYQEALDQVELADDLGYDYVWEVEHHFLEEYSHSSAPEVFLAAAAERTDDIRLGHGIKLLPPEYNPPQRVAEQVATLDLVSDGRVEWGTGESASRIELEGFGVDPGEKFAAWQEATEATADMMAMEPYPGHDGEHFSMPVRNVVPKPVQDPRPPIWVGASNESSIRRGARIADGFLGAHVPFDVASEQVEIFRDERANEGKSPGEVGFLREAFVAPTTEAAEAAVRDPLMDKYESYSDWGQDRVIAGDDFDSLWDQLRQQRFLMGDPDDVAADVERYQRELDLDHVFVRTQFPNTDPEDVQESIRLFGERVIPRFN